MNIHSISEDMRLALLERIHTQKANIRHEKDVYIFTARLYDEIYGDVKYIPSSEQWVTSTDTHWRNTTLIEVEHIIREHFFELFWDAFPPLEGDGDPDGKRVRAWIRAKAAFTGYAWKDALKVILADDSFTDDHDDWFPCRNGLVNVKNGKFDIEAFDHRKHRNRAYTETLMKYIPREIWYGKNRPMFGIIMDEWLPDREDQVFLQRIFGRAFLGESDRTVLAIISPGGSGKTSFTNIIKNAFGHLAMSGSEHIFGGRYNNHNDELADVIEKRIRLILLPEFGSSKILTEKLNAFTGGEGEMRTRRSGSTTGNIAGRVIALPIFIGESMPETTHMTKGFIDRLSVFSIQSVAEEKKDPRILQESSDPKSILVQEALSWIVEGAIDYLEKGMPRKSRKMEKSTDAILEETSEIVFYFRAYADVLTGYTSSQILDAARKYFVHTPAVIEEYDTPRKIGKLLTRLGWETKRRIRHASDGDVENAPKIREDYDL